MITSRRTSNIDWDALEEYFVKQTGPRVGYREFAAMTPDMAITGNQEIHYKVIKDYAKEQRWWSKRTEYLRKHNPGLYEDSEIIYGLVVNRLVEEGDTMAARDLGTLVGQFTKLQELQMSHRPEGEGDDDVERFTRDDILQMFADYVPPDKGELLRQAAESLRDDDAEDEE